MPQTESLEVNGHHMPILESEYHDTDSEGYARLTVYVSAEEYKHALDSGPETGNVPDSVKEEIRNQVEEQYREHFSLNTFTLTEEEKKLLVQSLEINLGAYEEMERDIVNREALLEDNEKGKLDIHRGLLTLQKLLVRFGDPLQDKSDIKAPDYPPED